MSTKVSISLAIEKKTNKTSKYQYTASLSSGQPLYLASRPKILRLASLPPSVGESSTVKHSASQSAFACLPSCQEIALNPGFPQSIPNFRVVWWYPPCGTTFCAVAWADRLRPPCSHTWYCLFSLDVFQHLEFLYSSTCPRHSSKESAMSLCCHISLVWNKNIVMTILSVDWFGIKAEVSKCICLFPLESIFQATYLNCPT